MVTSVRFLTMAFCCCAASAMWILASNLCTEEIVYVRKGCLQILWAKGARLTVAAPCFPWTPGA
jgi:hypothetical protein